MSRQIQIRRGTATEHNNFTGAPGEITMDTTNKTLRVHDGTTAGGTAMARRDELDNLARRDELIPATADYVVASQLPTAANNYTWYRKYKSGWVEQGSTLIGNFVNSGTSWNSRFITLPIPMADTTYRYTALANYNWTDGTTSDDGWWFDEQSTTTQARLTYIGFSSQATFMWRICGMAAS